MRDVDGDVLSDEDDGEGGDEFSVVASLAPPGPRTPTGYRTGKRRKTEGGAASSAPTLIASSPAAVSVVSNAMAAPAFAPRKRDRSVSGSPAKASLPATPPMSSMLDPSAAPSAAETSEDLSKMKKSAASKVRDEIEELKITHDKRMQEFWWCGDPETAKRLTKGHGRPSYHLGELAKATTKCTLKLGDKPEADKFQSRHSDWEVVKTALEVFRACNIAGEFNKVKKGVEFAEFLDTVKARPKVWCKLPLMAVKWGAQLKIEVLLRLGSSPIQYLHIEMLKKTYTSIVLAQTAQQVTLQQVLFEVCLSEALCKAATFSDDQDIPLLETQAAFILNAFIPPPQDNGPADRALKEKEDELKISERCTAQNMWTSPTLANTAMHLQQVILLKQVDGSTATLQTSLQELRGDSDNPVFTAFISHEQVGQKLLYRADIAVKDMSKQETLEKNTLAVSSAIECLRNNAQRPEVSSLIGSDKADDTATSELEDLKDSIAKCCASLALVDGEEQCSSAVQVGLCLKPVIGSLAKAWNASGASVFMQEMASCDAPAGAVVKEQFLESLSHHRVLEARYKVILGPACDMLKAADAAAEIKDKTLLPGHHLATYFTTLMQVIEAWIDVHLLGPQAQARLPVNQSMVSADVFEGASWDDGYMEAFTKLCSAWAAHRDLANTFHPAQSAGLRKWLSKPLRDFQDMIQDNILSISDDGPPGPVKKSIIAHTSKAVCPASWDRFFSEDSVQRSRECSIAVKFNLDEAKIRAALTVCNCVFPGSDSARVVAHTRLDSLAKTSFGLVFTSVPRQQSTCKVMMPRVEKAIRAIAALAAAQQDPEVVAPAVAAHYMQADLVLHQQIFAPFLRQLSAQVEQSVNALPKDYVALVGSDVEDAIKGTFMKKPNVILAASIDEMQSYFTFIQVSKMLSKCFATSADSVLLGEFVKTCDQHKKLMAFYATSKIVNLVINKLNADPKPSQQAKGNMMKTSAWPV